MRDKSQHLVLFYAPHQLDFDRPDIDSTLVADRQYVRLLGLSPHKVPESSLYILALPAKAVALREESASTRHKSLWLGDSVLFEPESRSLPVTRSQLRSTPTTLD